MIRPLAPTHKCPGCRKVDVSNERFACQDCWAALPDDLRWRIQGSHRVNVLAHNQAKKLAVQWYHKHRINRGDDPQ